MFDTSKILDFLSNKKKATFLQIAKGLNVPPRLNKELSNTLFNLKKQGTVAYSRRDDLYAEVKLIGEFEGEISINKPEYGFVNFLLNDSENRAIVFKENFKGSLKGDVVLFEVFEDPFKEDSYFAIVKKIIERKNSKIFALVKENKIIQAIGFSQDVEFIYNKDELKIGDYVSFQILSVNKNKVELKLNKIITNINQAHNDFDLLSEMNQLPKGFDGGVLEEAKQIPDEVEDATKDSRRDLRNELIVTIDGEKTKDFDDAISVTKTDKNTYILGVHIADVAYYVKEGSLIDQEALRRATSIYLIDKVIPMLPEKLSNGICSLNPNVDRYTLSVEAEIDNKGKVLWTKFFPSTINSKYRLTYDQVANYINDEVFQKDKQLFEMIKNSYELSEILSKIKYEQGYIDFEIEEPQIELDQMGKAIGIKQKDRLSSEILIENFMVFANESVSEYVSKLKDGIDCIYRVHELPSEDKINNLNSVLKTLNIKVKADENISPKSFANTIEAIKKERFDNFIKITLLRTMQKAKYSIDNIGHFGLASKYYSHFTSPIRRYPDLALHRILWEIVFKKNKSYTDDLASKLNTVATISSKKEEDAVSAERKYNDIKRAEYYQTKVGQVYEGVVVSIQKFGLFVEFPDKTDALVHISNIKDSRSCVVNEFGTQMTCDAQQFILGQTIKVEIISTFKLEGKIDAKIV